MTPLNPSDPASKGASWTGRILSGLVVLFLLFDAITKILKVPAVMKAAAQMKFSAGQIVFIGVVLLICTIVYIIPRTAILGAILLTGYLGGATAIQMHRGNPPFETVFPVFIGLLAWLGIFLRDRRIRALIPVDACRRDSR